MVVPIPHSDLRLEIANLQSGGTMADDRSKPVSKPFLWGGILLCEILWCFLAGSNAGALNLGHVVSLLASLGFGTVLGVFSAFLFTSSGKEEEATIGKIRDWLIAGITGAGAAEVMERGGPLNGFF